MYISYNSSSLFDANQASSQLPDARADLQWSQVAILGLVFGVFSIALAVPPCIHALHLLHKRGQDMVPNMKDLPTEAQHLLSSPSPPAISTSLIPDQTGSHIRTSDEQDQELANSSRPTATPRHGIEPTLQSPFECNHDEDAPPLYEIDRPMLPTEPERNPLSTTGWLADKTTLIGPLRWLLNTRLATDEGGSMI